MNDLLRSLIGHVCDGDIIKSQKAARIILNRLSTQKDSKFKEWQLRKLDARPANFIELPANLKDLLIAEDSDNFPINRFILPEEERSITHKILALFKASTELMELGIGYVPSLMLYGQSGTGKTMLARYIAHKAQMPFVYVRFSSIVSSYLGSTQANIARIFDYAKTSPCVLCFDEIDAVGMARGQKNDVGEMNRIVIALMQELDRCPNNVILIGTSNRHDRLDDALLRRFYLKHEVTPLNTPFVEELAVKLFVHAGYSQEYARRWCKENFNGIATAAEITNKCTERIVADIVAKQVE